MPDKLVLRGASPEDAASETALSEEGVRQALARLGRGASHDDAEARRPEPGRDSLDPFRPGSVGHGGGHGGGQNGGNQRRAAAPMHKLKRPAFVQDGDVVVEYAGRDRPGYHDISDQGRADQGRSALDALRDELARERRVREEAERSLHETRLALQGLQTRLAHLELDLNEARSAARAAQDDAGPMAVGRVQAAAAAPAATRPAAPEPALVPRPEGPAAVRVPKVRRQQATPQQAKSRASTREPQPVKWWIKSKG
ncbi:hypothetical protein [Lichenicoccus sp.]|uniref:hypothetical protein n=1 Tax=Lichenicoccus sp. TaxID=2781899 RepID=UPI003D0E19E1